MTAGVSALYAGGSRSIRVERTDSGRWLVPVGSGGEMDEAKTFFLEELWEELQVFLGGRDGELGVNFI